MDHQVTETQIKQSVRALLAGAIDYAGLFPPTGLSMPEAVINYATYRNSNYNWMLGRFVVPASRLPEFYEASTEFVSRDPGHAWQVSVIGGENLEDSLRVIDDLCREKGPGIICDTIEIKADSNEAIETAAALIPENITPYFEVPLNEHMADLIASIALKGYRAKVRTGGLTPDAIPNTAEVVRFVRTCLAANIPFKATAGLHHPIRCFKPLSYESDAQNGTMHGFLNLFLMTGFASEGYKVQLLEDVMEDEFEEVFRFEDQAAVWRDDFTLNLWQIERLRSRGIQSFGSCSFDEPVADLQKLGIL